MHLTARRFGIWKSIQASSGGLACCTHVMIAEWHMQVLKHLMAHRISETCRPAEVYMPSLAAAKLPHKVSI